MDGFGSVVESYYRFSLLYLFLSSFFRIYSPSSPSLLRQIYGWRVEGIYLSPIIVFITFPRAPVFLLTYPFLRLLPYLFPFLPFLRQTSLWVKDERI